MFSPVHSVFCSYSLSDWICSVSSLWIVVSMYRQIPACRAGKFEFVGGIEK